MYCGIVAGLERWLQHRIHLWSHPESERETRGERAATSSSSRWLKKPHPDHLAKDAPSVHVPAACLLDTQRMRGALRMTRGRIQNRLLGPLLGVIYGRQLDLGFRRVALLCSRKRERDASCI